MLPLLGWLCCCLGLLLLTPAALASLALVWYVLLPRILTASRWTLSRPLVRCISSGILNVLPKLLDAMGRWAQARRHGSGSQGYTQAPPTNADWTIDTDSGQIIGQSNNAGPGGQVAVMFVQCYTAVAPGTIVEQILVPLNDSATGVHVFVAGTLVGARASWRLASGAQTSGWSAEKTIVV